MTVKRTADSERKLKFKKLVWIPGTVSLSVHDWSKGIKYLGLAHSNAIQNIELNNALRNNVRS